MIAGRLRAWRSLLVARWHHGDRLGLVLAAAFLWFAAPLGVILIGVVPPGQAADEGLHAVRIASLAGGHFLGRRELVQTGHGLRVLSGVDADPGIAAATIAVRGGAQHIVTFDRLALARIATWQGRDSFLGIGMAAGYFPVFYLPSAAVVAAVRAAGVGPFQAVITARAANFLIYVAGAVATLLLARRGHLLLFGVLSAPVPLALAASLNQDGRMQLAACLAAALLSRRGTEARIDANGLIAAILLACVALAKPPYAPLTLLLLLPLPHWRHWRAEWRLLVGRAVLVAGATLPAVAWSGYIAAHLLIGVPYETYRTGVLWPYPPLLVDGFAPDLQRQVMEAHPALLLRMALETAFASKRFLFEMFGGIGFMDVTLPQSLLRFGAWGAAGALLGDLFGRGGPARPVPVLDLLLAALAAIAAAVAICLSLYLNWTPVGATFIFGVQGRYMLPLIPLLAITLPRLALPGAGALRVGGCAVVLAAMAAITVLMPAALVSEHYLH
jgi:hypothetical protein